jgi:DNA-binding transcriptional LysR family regulator
MIENEPFISFREGYGLRTILQNFCLEAGLTPDIVFEGEDIGTVSGLVSANLGVSIVPNIEALKKTKVKMIHVKNPICNRKIGIAHLKDGYLSPVSRNFIQYVQGVVHNN